MFRNVIVGVDGRPGGRDAISLAAQLLAPGGELLLAHVRSAGEGLSAQESTALLEREPATVRERIVSVEAMTVSEGLHALVEEHHAELLVLGSCRRGAAGRALLGDDTRASVDHLACAAAVAPHGYAQNYGPIGTIGVGYDGTAHSEETLAAAQRLAGELGATVRALMVLSVPPAAYAQPASLGYSQAAPFAANETGDILLQRAERDMAELHGVDGLVACGPPGLELEAFSDSLGLLVLGSARRGRLARLLLGSATRHLLRTAHCPLLLLARPQVSEAGGEVQPAGAVQDAHAAVPQSG